MENMEKTIYTKFVNDNIKPNMRHYFLDLYECITTFQYFWERQSNSNISYTINKFKHCMEDVINLITLDKKDEEYNTKIFIYTLKSKIWLTYIGTLENIFILPPLNSKLRGKVINQQIYIDSLSKVNLTWQELKNRFSSIKNLNFPKEMEEKILEHCKNKLKRFGVDI